LESMSSARMLAAVGKCACAPPRLLDASDNSLPIEEMWCVGPDWERAGFDHCAEPG
jgi:hypothetical protein